MINQLKLLEMEKITLVIINTDIMIYHGKLVSGFGPNISLQVLVVSYVYISGQNYEWVVLDDPIQQELLQ